MVSAKNLSTRRAIVFAALLKAPAEIFAARPMIFVAATRKKARPSSLRRRRGFDSGPGARRVAAAASDFHAAINLPAELRALFSCAVPSPARPTKISPVARGSGPRAQAGSAALSCSGADDAG